MQKKILHYILVISFVFQQAGMAQTAVPPAAAPVGAPAFRPLQLRSVSFDPQASAFAFIADPGDTAGQATADNTIDYFKTGLTFPNQSFWVNLRPDGADQMLDPVLENSEVARVMLAADVQLKKDLAAMTDPDTPAGRRYWQQVYEKAASLFGREENMEIPALTRPWIVPGEIIIGESENQAFVYKAMLKVCVQEDYLAGSRSPGNPAPAFADPRLKLLNEYSSGLIRALIIPHLTRKVNSAKEYAQLRQVFYSLVLAQWVKDRFPGRAFSFPEEQSADAGVHWSKMDYFKKYQESFQRGEYSKDETILQGSDLVVRHYSSGGIEAFLHGNRELIRVPAHLIQRAAERIPGLVVLPAVQAQVVAQHSASSRDGGMSVEQIEKALEHAIGKAAVERAKAGNARGYQLFLEIIQAVPGQDEGRLSKLLADIASLVGASVLAECLYSEPFEAGMFLERLSDKETEKFFIGLSALVGPQAVRSALLNDLGSFVEGIIDRGGTVGEKRFLELVEDLFGGDGMPIARGMVARSDGYFEEYIEQAGIPEKAALLDQCLIRFGRQAVLDALSISAEDFVEALFARDNAALEEAIIRSRELMQRFHRRITGSASADFVQALADASRETEVSTIAAGLADLFRLQDVLYPDNSGLIDLDQGRPVLLIPDVHSRRNELFAVLQKKDANGTTNLEKVLRGELQLVVLGDLVHSENGRRWQEIEKGLDNRDDRALQAEIADGLGTVEMVLMLKGRCPGSVHWLRGNHDSVTENLRKYTERGGGEGALVRSWLEDALGEDFVRAYSRLEKRLPLMVRGKNFLASHSEPGIPLRQAQIAAKSVDAVYALNWTRDEGRHSRQLLREMLGSEEGLYIAGHTPQPDGMTFWPERGLILLNDQRRLQSLIIDGQQVIHDERGPVWQFAREQAAADAGVYAPAVSHSFVNEYIENNLPDYLYERNINDRQIKDIVREVIQTHCPEVEGYGVKARVIPVQGLFAHTRQFAHIGLGGIYGMPVIYCDQDYVGDQTVLGHELYEIAKWEGLRQSLKLQPEEMRRWIRENITVAQEKATAWHEQAPSLNALFAAAGEQGVEEFSDPYAGEEDVNLGAQLSLDDFYFQRHPLIDIARFEADAISVYQEGNGIEYRDLAVSRLPVNTNKAVARIYRYGYGYGRLLMIFTRKDINLTDDLVIALAKIGEGFNIKSDNPKASFQKVHQRRLSALVREDTGKAFGKNRVVVNGRYYYTEKGELKSREIKDMAVLQNQEAVRRLLSGEKIFGKSIIGVSSAIRGQAEAVRREIKENRRLQRQKAAGQQTLDAYSAADARRDGGYLMDKELAVFPGIDTPLKSFVALEQRSLFLAQLSHFFDRDLEFNSMIRLRVRDLEENDQQVEISSVKNIVMRLMFNAYDSIATLYDDQYCQAKLPQESLQLLDRKTKRTINVRYTKETKFGKQALKVEVEDNGAGNRAADYSWKNRSQREGNKIYLGGLGMDNKIIFFGDEQTGQQSLLQILWAAAGVGKGDFYEYNENDRGAKVALWIPMDSLKDGVVAGPSRDGGVEAVEASIEDYLAGELGDAGTVTFDLAAEGVAEEIAGRATSSGAARIIRLDMSGFKPGGLLGARSVVDSYRLIKGRIWDLGEALRPALGEPRDAESRDRPSFAIEELIKNAFVHGNDGNFDLPIYLVIDMHEGKFSRARVLDMAAYVNTGLASASEKVYAKPGRIIHDYQQAVGILSERWDYRAGDGSQGFAFTWKGQTFGMATIAARDGGRTGPASYGKFAPAYQAVWKQLRTFTGGDKEALKTSSFRDFMEFFDVRAIEPWVLGGYEYTAPGGEKRNISFAPMFTITQAGYDRFKQNAPALAEKLAAGGFDRGGIYYHERYFGILSAMFGRGNLDVNNEFLGKITVFHELCETEIMERFPETLGSPTRQFFEHTDLSIIEAELAFAALAGKETFMQRAGIWRTEISTTKLTSGKEWPQDFLERTDAIYSRLTGILLHPEESWRAYARAAEHQLFYPQIDGTDVAPELGAQRDGGSIQESIEDFILTRLGKDAIVPVDLKEDHAGEEVTDVLLKRKGQAVRLDVSGYKPVEGALMEAGEDYLELKDAIETLGEKIQIAMHLDFDSRAANNLSFAVEELIKNAFVHGNKCNFDLPIYLMLELNGNEFRSLQVIDMAAGENPGLAGDENGLFYAMNAGMTGFNNGIKWLQRDSWELVRGDGMPQEGSFALRWKNNLFGSVKISSRDGGQEGRAADPGGIDLRRLSATPASAPLAARRQEIDRFFRENTLPAAVQLQDCLTRCANDTVGSIEQSAALACVLQIMKTEESLSQPSHPGLIAILALLCGS